MILDRSSTAPQLPPLASDHSLGSMSGALPITDLLPHDEPSLSQQVLGVSDPATEEESRDTLGVPAPIGKYQPSWDPFNATPIAEEEGFQYEDRPKASRQLSSESGLPRASLNVPRESMSKSERSNSSDAHFYDTHEEQADPPNDWVMVPDKDAVAAEQTETEGDVNLGSVSQTSLDAPVTSILNRPRGSSYGVPSPPLSAPTSTFSASPSPAAAPISILPPSQQTPSTNGQTSSSAIPTSAATAPVQSPPPAATVEQPEQQAPGILPPIRRTSTFGLSLGKRQVKPRFPIEDEEDEPRPVPQQNFSEHRGAGMMAAAGATLGVAAIAHHEKKKEAEVLSLNPTEPSANILTQPSPPTSAAKPDMETQVQSTRPEQSPIARSPRHVVPPIDTSVQHQNLISQQPVTMGPPAMQTGSAEYNSTSSRPSLGQAGSSEYSQRTMTSIPQPQPPQQQPPPRFGPSRQGDVAFRPQNVESSHVEWKPNRPKAAPAPAPVPASPSAWKEQDMGPPPRSSIDQQPHRRQNSYDAQRTRGYSGSSQSYGKNIEDFGDRTPYVASPIQQKPFEQPPSAAQRYPDLFKPENHGSNIPRESDDLPAHYYQEPLGRAAFLPRHQTNEYQLPGVGPPEEIPTPTKRGSGFFREIGGRLSRGSSRERGHERGGSFSREVAQPSPSRPFESRATEYAESEASEAAVEQKKRRSGFFAGLKRTSTSGLGAPVSQESVIAHPPSSQMASRTDLLATPQQSPVVQHERKRSIFGSHSAEPKSKPNKLVRVSTGNSGGSSAPNSAPVDEAKKKQRFSGLSGKIFGKSSPSAVKEPVQQRPQATRELSYAERQPLDSPGFPPGMHPQTPIQNQTPLPVQAPPSQARTIMSRFNSNSPSPSPRQDAKHQESKTRKQSASNILGGLMGRRPQQQERMGSDSSRSGGGSQSNLAPHTLPAAQTYSDLQKQEQQQQQQQPAPPPQAAPRPPTKQKQAREIPFQDPSISTPDRGRRVSREPQYDQVPIPGGYDLVRGQGAMVAPSGYDPRGYNIQQVDPRYAQPRAQGFYNQHQGYPQQNGHQYQGGPQLQGGPVRQPQPKLNLSPIETYNSAPRRISREDLLARSPPKSPEGQQRPYQLSLPDEDIEDRPAPIQKDLPTFPTPPTKLKHDAIQRLQQPTLRHPESPAGYPLPDDTVFSPVNPIASQIPAPPAPRWPGPQSPSHSQQNQDSGMRHERGNSLTQSLSTMDIDLDRSNTRRTAVSAVSGISDPQNPMSIQSARGSLNVPGRNGHSLAENGEESGGGRGIDRNMSVLRSSPSPPSPMGSREVSPEPSPRIPSPGDEIKTTQLHVRNPSGSEDLYSASPRLPKNVERFPSSATESSERGPERAASVRDEAADTVPSMESARSQVVSSRGVDTMRSDTTGSDGLGIQQGASSQTAGLGRGQGSVVRREVLRQAQGEKIPIDEDGEEIDVPLDENAPPSMSATSYPGQEW
jgi:hypothetical protein